MIIAQIEPPQDENGGDYYYRTLAPGMAMAREDDTCVINLTNVHRNRERIAREADILVLKNVCDPDLLPIIDRRKRDGRMTIYELADDVAAVPPWNPVYFFYQDQENISLLKRLASFCDAVQFSVPELQRVYGRLNPCSIVFPNQISIVPKQKELRRKPEIVLGWGGSHGHLEDMAEIAGSLIDWMLLREHVRLYLMCSDPIWALFDRLPEKRKKRFLPGSLDSYYSFLHKLDIGLAPLKETSFNRSRSDIKYLEYAAHSVAPVLRNMPPYASTVRDKETGFLFNGLPDLLRILDSLTQDPELIWKTASAAREYVLSERLQNEHAIERTSFYRSKCPPGNDGIGSDSSGRELFEDLSRIDGAVRSGRHLRLLPTRFEALLHDGLVLSQIEKQTMPAHRAFMEASRLEPDSYLPHLFGAFCSEDPVNSLEEATRKNPYSIKAWILLGEQHARKGRAAPSLKCFETAAEIFPSYDTPYLRTARLLEKMGHEKEARSLLEKARAVSDLC